MICGYRQICAAVIGVVLFMSVFASEPQLSNIPQNEGVVIFVNNNQKSPLEKDPTLLLAQHPQLQKVDYATPIKADVQEAELLPHRATYAVSLDKPFDPDILDVTGTMTIEITDAGEQWTYEKKATLLISYHDKSIEQINIKVASWESKEKKSTGPGEGGPRYHFYVKVKRGTEAIEDHDEPEEGEGTIIQGEALMATPQGEGIVSYQAPQTLDAKLPIGTLFPLQHMTNLMREAVQGRNVCSHIVFDGENESIAYNDEDELHEIVRVNTVIAPINNAKIKFSDAVPFPTEHAWLMHMAVYDINTQEDNPDPDYEISQTVLPHGIIARMTYNFGDFNAHLKLTELEFFE